MIGDQPLEAPAFITALFNMVGGIQNLREHLWRIAVLIAAAAVLRGFVNYFSGRWAAQASESIARRLRNTLYTHLQQVPALFYNHHKTGDLIQRCTSDVETVRKFLAVQVVEVGRSVFMLVLIIPLLIMMNLKMAMISLIIVPFIITFAVLFFLKVKRTFQTADEAEGIMSAVLQENLTGIRVVRAFARQDFETGKFNGRNDDYRVKVYRLIRLLGMYWGLSDFLIYFQTGTVLVLGTYWTIQNEMTLGTLVAFLSYIEFLLWPIRQTGRTLTDMGKAFVSLGRIRDILDEKAEDSTGFHPKDQSVKGIIEFDNVTFGYGTDDPVIHNITLRIEKGETVVLIGPTGSGKSTMVNLLPRMWDYSMGSIKIDGRELGSYSRRYIRSQIGIVLQEPFLFSKSLIDNIRFGTPKNLNDAEVHDAARTAVIHDEILSFDGGYSTMVGERGVTLSGGQKQRIAIARTLIQDPPILIFDDSLSALDTETESRIRSALKQRKGRSTTIIIAHRLTTAMHADRVVVLENGQITQMGRHNELIRKPGLYQRLWEMQSAGGDEIMTITGDLTK